jgi:hypothetical protein
MRNTEEVGPTFIVANPRTGSVQMWTSQTEGYDDQYSCHFCDESDADDIGEYWDEAEGQTVLAHVQCAEDNELEDA